MKKTFAVTAVISFREVYCVEAKTERAALRQVKRILAGHVGRDGIIDPDDQEYLGGEIKEVTEAVA